MPQKGVRRAVEDGPPQRLAPPGFLDEAFGKQRLHGIVALHAAHLLDVRLRHRLAVGDDGQRFQHRLRERPLFQRLQKCLHLRGKLRADGQKHLAARAVELQAVALQGKMVGKLGKRRFHLRCRHVHRMGQVFHAHRVAGDEEDSLDDGAQFLHANTSA